MAMYGSDSAFNTFLLESSVDIGVFTVLGLSYNDRKQGHMTLEIPAKQDKSLSQVFLLLLYLFVCLFSVQNKKTHTVNKF